MNLCQNLYLRYGHVTYIPYAVLLVIVSSAKADILAFRSVIVHEPSQGHSPNMTVQLSGDTDTSRNSLATLYITHHKRWHKHKLSGGVPIMDGQLGTIPRLCTNGESMLALAGKFTR
jgi:hypothetical protein